MSSQRIRDSLAQLFETHPTVFWHDTEAEFVEQVATLDLEGVQCVRLDNTPALRIKLEMLNAPAQRWLLDVRLRSKSFRADSTSILLEDLGLTTRSLHSHLKDRAKFLRAKDRVEKLKRLVLPGDTAQDLDRKMLAVLTRADSPELFVMLQRLYGGCVVDGVADLAAQPKTWQDICVNDLQTPFWELVQQLLGYADPKPTLRDLLVRILVTDFCRSLVGDAPRQLAHFALPERSLAANASVFAARWRSDIAQYANYNALAQAVAQDLELNSLLAGQSAEELVDCMTFEEVELRVVQDLKKRIVTGGGANMDVVRGHISRRRDGHWANPLMASAHDHTRALAACYDALTAAADFFSLKAIHIAGFSFVNAAAAFAQYRDELFRFDQLYRQFHTAADAVEPTGWAVLHELRASIESVYSGWYIPQLSTAWSKVVEGPQGLLAHLRLPEVTPQQKFFDQRVMPLYEGAVKRVFVVISDAFRFEVAMRVAFDYFKANSPRVSASIKPGERDFHSHLVELQNTGVPQSLTLASFIALCSAALTKPVQSQLAVMGDMSLGGTIVQVRNLAESMQVAFDAGAKRILLPMSSVTDIPSVPGELFAKFQTSFYSDPVDAVFKALGVE